MNVKKLTDAQRTALAETKKHFTTWRQTKSGRARIPEFLWTKAVNLFRTGGFSVNQIARGLSLSHSTLKKRISGQSDKAVQTAPTTTFIEVESPHSPSDCVIEIESRSGSKMRMCFRGKADPVLVDLGRLLLAEPT